MYNYIYIYLEYSLHRWVRIHLPSMHVLHHLLLALYCCLFSFFRSHGWRPKSVEKDAKVILLTIRCPLRFVSMFCSQGISESENRNNS